MPFIYPLCSSSKGNCYYVGDDQKGILIDAGIGIRKFAAQLALIGVPETAVQAIFITHEHSDHISGLARIDKKLQVPVYASAGTAHALLHKGAVEQTRLFCTEQETVLSNLSVTRFSTLHDAAESQGYRIDFLQHRSVAVCTDLGVVTETVQQALDGCQTVVLESNYEKELLSLGSYPYFLKQRIAGKYGHLSNADAGFEMERLLKQGTKTFVLAHLSEENNRPDIAYHHAVDHLQQTGAVLQQDYQLWVAPRSGVGNTVAI